MHLKSSAKISNYPALISGKCNWYNMSQTHSCHFWVLVHISPEATAASSLGRWNIDKEEKLTLSDRIYSTQSLPVLWSSFNQTINKPTAKFNRTPRAHTLAPSSFCFLGNYHVFADHVEITLQRNQSKANREFMYKKKKN